MSAKQQEIVNFQSHPNLNFPSAHDNLESNMSPPRQIIPRLKNNNLQHFLNKPDIKIVNIPVCGERLLLNLWH